MFDPLKLRSLVARVRSVLLPLILLLLLSLVAVTAAYQVPVSLFVDVGSEADGAYVVGMYPREVGEEINYRWTGDKAQIVFHNAGQIVRNGVLRVRFIGYRAPEVTRPKVSFSLNGQLLARFTAPADFIEPEYQVDAARFGEGDWVLEMESDTWKPASDPRTLGLLVDYGELAARAGPVFPPFMIAFGTFLCGVGLGWLGERLVNRRVGLAVGALGIIAVSAGLVVWREGIVYAVKWLPLFLLTVGGVIVLKRGRARLCNGSNAQQLAVTGVGLVLVLAGELVILVDGALPLAVSLVTAGALVLFAAPSHFPTGAADRLPLRRELVLLGLVTLLALGIRLYQLEAVPFGIFRDEARHGLTALRILNDPQYRPIFLGPPISQPTPFFFALAGAFQMWGVNLFSLRIVSALAGVLAVPGLWLFSRELFGARVGLLAAFGLAISSWHTTISRFAMPYAEPTVFALVAYWALWRGVQRGRWYYYALAGLLIALAQYAAQTSKVLFVIAALIVVDSGVRAWKIQDRRALFSIGRGTLVAATVGMAVLLPLLAFVVQYPDEYLARPGQVALWNSEVVQGQYLLDAFAENAAKYAGAFNLVGDPNGRHHMPGAPLLDPLLGALMILGIVAVLQNLNQSQARIMVYWFGVGLVPGLLSVDAPSGLRIIEAAPAAYACAALGMYSLWESFTAIGGAQKRIAVTVAAAVLAAALLYNVQLYFVRMYESPEVWRKYAPIATQLGVSLRTLGTQGKLSRGSTVFVPEAMLEGGDDTEVLKFLSNDEFRFQAFDGERAARPRPGSVVVIPNEAAYWRLVAAMEPRYASRADQALQTQTEWLARAQPLLSGATLVQGPSFPASSLPTFELYLRR